MPDEVYLFTEQAFENLARAEVSPLAVTDVLHVWPAVRRHIGGVTSVSSARYLDDDEIAAISRFRKER